MIWVFITMTYAHYTLPAALLTSLISMGSASLLGIAVWHVCRRWPWPLRLTLKFYSLHIFLAFLYALVWNVFIYGSSPSPAHSNPIADLWASRVLGFQLLTGVWMYGLFAGVSLRAPDAQSPARKGNARRCAPKRWQPPPVWMRFARA